MKTEDGLPAIFQCLLVIVGLVLLCAGYVLGELWYGVRASIWFAARRKVNVNDINDLA